MQGFVSANLEMEGVGAFQSVMLNVAELDIVLYDLFIKGHLIMHLSVYYVTSLG